MVRRRNEIVHIYDEIAADKIYEEIVSKFLNDIKVILKNIKESETD